MITYRELEDLRHSWKGEVCIFGAGKFGTGERYEFIKAAGFSIDFYCDNYVAPGTHVRDGLVVRDIQYLYAHREDVLVFVCVSGKYKNEIIEKLKNHGVDHIVHIEYDCILQIMEEVDKADDEVKKRWHYFYDDAEFLTRVFKKRMGYDLDLEHPRTFNEKLQWLKLYDRNPAYTQMVDKYAVKEYIAQKIGEEYVIPTLGVYGTFDEIVFEKLPNQFVLKCTHDSGSTVICRDKNCFDKEKAKETLERHLGINFYWVGREWPYKEIKPRIIAEKYLLPASGEQINDYKIMCFEGRPYLIELICNRFTKPTQDFYDVDWNKTEIYEQDIPPSNFVAKRPLNLGKMLELSEKLAQDIHCLRVDWYNIDRQLYLGELTFFDGSGFDEFFPESVGVALGNLIKIP